MCMYVYVSLSFSLRHYEQGGFSTLAVDSLRIEMAELLDRVIKKRRLQMHGREYWLGDKTRQEVNMLVTVSITLLPSGYELERKDRPGLIVDVNSTLESQGTMDFMLVQHIGRYTHYTVYKTKLQLLFDCLLNDHDFT